MIVKEQTEERTSSREKSALYPSISIEECMHFVEQVDSLGGKVVPYDSILSMMNISSQYTKSFMNRISSAKQFGLIVTNSQKVQITDLGKRILYQTGAENEKRDLLIEAFQNPPLYKKLIERFYNKPLPPKELLGNILLNEYAIIKAVKDKAAACFLKSASYLGLLDTGVLCIKAQDVPADTENSPTQVPQADSKSDENANQASAEETEPGYSFAIPTLGQKVARFYIPAGVTQKDVEFIELYIKQMIPAFLENLKEKLS